MDMRQIEVYAHRIRSKHALFLFDSCFSGSLFALSRAVPENITYKTAQPVRPYAETAHDFVWRAATRVARIFLRREAADSSGTDARRTQSKSSRCQAGGGR